ncbi:MAG: PilZ domain-containing protein [Deltaproteobacteria bacterium]|nr:PilZ domain-containing protein [Deltaproteobacteria bacterium]
MSEGKLFQGPDKRRDPRVAAQMRVGTSSIDPVRDPVTGELCFVATDDDCALDVSRRGLRLRCARPPTVGTRMVVHIPADGDDGPIEVVGRARWVTVEFERGVQGARAVGAVGIELVGGSPAALDRFERCVSRCQTNPVAGPEALG